MSDTILKVKVVPNSSRDQLVGFMDNGFYKVKLKVPPEDGKANKALITLLSKKLGVIKKAVVIERGETSPEKVVRIVGVGEDAVKELL